jgi:hypothetical protein
MAVRRGFKVGLAAISLRGLRMLLAPYRASALVAPGQTRLTSLLSNQCASGFVVPRWSRWHAWWGRARTMDLGRNA